MGLPKIKFVVREDKEKDKDKKRPLTLDLIIIYNIFQLIIGALSIVPGYGGVMGLGAILMIFGLYYGLWKMKKDWMWVFVFVLSATTGFYIFFSIIETLNMIGVTIVVLNILCIYWLYNHRNIFIEPEKGKSALGTKKEWVITIILVIILLIIISRFSAWLAPLFFG